MELVSQKTKAIMEECKTRARKAGLSLHSETLEYITTNKTMLELMPKHMIPTLYDYWVDGIEVIRNKWVYDVVPYNPYETVINTRPAISYYNDNNADWVNIMIFYHVIAHINLYHNNVFFRNTWGKDFCGQALSDKRLIERIREDMGVEKRWVDYVIESARSIDNLTGYYRELGEDDRINAQGVLGAFTERINFYFGDFLKQRYKKGDVSLKLYHEEVERLNVCYEEFGERRGEEVFFNDSVFRGRFPEFGSIFGKRQEKKKPKPKDLFEYLTERSRFINRNENMWMKDVLGVIRRTSLHFAPHLRTKRLHEGWASLWHEKLFLNDPRVKSHEVEFALMDASVTAHRRIGSNPYSTKYLLEFIANMAEKGRFSREYQLLKNIRERKLFDKKPEEGISKKTLFEVAYNFNDAMLINFLSDSDFQDFINRHNLFTVGQRVNSNNGTVEIYIKSKNGRDYRKMLNDQLYHPPHILINEDKASKKDELYLEHVFEGRTLVTGYIQGVLRGLAYLNGNTVKLETTEFQINSKQPQILMLDSDYVPKYKKLRVLYKCEDRHVERKVISPEDEKG